MIQANKKDKKTTKKTQEEESERKKQQQKTKQQRQQQKQNHNKEKETQSTKQCPTAFSASILGAAPTLQIELQWWGVNWDVHAWVVYTYSLRVLHSFMTRYPEAKKREEPRREKMCI